MAVAYVTKYNPTTNPVTTGASFSVSVTVAAGDYIVLAIGVGNNSTVTTAPAGGGLTYTQQVAKNPGGSIGSLYKYTATSASAQTFNLTGTMSASGAGIGVTVARYSGVGSIGAVNSANGTAGTGSSPSMSLTTSTANSVVDVSVTDWAGTAGTSTWVTTSGTATIVGDDLASGQVADHSAYYPFATAGAKTLGMSAPSSQVWCMGAVELVAGSSTPLTNSVAPAVTPSGTQVVGTALSTSNGTWSATPDSFTYQWNRDGVAIGAATSSSYTTTSTDIGHAITCTVTAIKAGFTNGTATSNSVPVVAPPAFQGPTRNWTARMRASNW